LLQHPQPFGTTEGYLSENIVSVVCNGAAVMPGNHYGVNRLMKEKFPSDNVGQCVNRRLELPISDAVHTVSGINRFNYFTANYILYNASTENNRELHACAKLLERKLLVIGRILTARLAA
jgi:hypothetical protein